MQRLGGRLEVWLQEFAQGLEYYITSRNEQKENTGEGSY